ncbi:MAG: prepilin-type N-terminal cleavage/methylation domain-containing protein [Candidatus Omnitrophota bacterium]
MRRLKGFTLIELLIVVAIIGILAAIAVPNFLNARVRALATRSMADIRTLSDAVNMYRIDHNSPPFRRPGWPCGLCDEEQIEATYNMAGLTSPVAFVATIPFDPFIDITGVRIGDNRGDGLPVGWYLYVAHKKNLPVDTLHGSYWVWGWGPDKTRQSYPRRPYDPTNGLTSKGDIIADEKHGFLRDDLTAKTSSANADIEDCKLP